MDYLTFVVLIVPALIGLLSATALGPNLGVAIGAAVAIVAVLLLLLLQVTPASFSSAWGLLWFEWIRWVPSFLVGAALGSLIARLRRRTA